MVGDAIEVRQSAYLDTAQAGELTATHLEGGNRGALTSSHHTPADAARCASRGNSLSLMTLACCIHNDLGNESSLAGTTDTNRHCDPSQRRKWLLKTDLKSYDRKDPPSEYAQSSGTRGSSDESVDFHGERPPGRGEVTAARVFGAKSPSAVSPEHRGHLGKGQGHSFSGPEKNRRLSRVQPRLSNTALR